MIHRSQLHQFVGNKANLKRANLKTEVTRKQSTPNFPKNKHFLPPDTHTYVCVSPGKKCSFFGKFGVLCFLKLNVNCAEVKFLYLNVRRCNLLSKINCKSI